MSELSPAGRGARFGAAVIDLALVMVLGVFLVLATGAAEDAEAYAGSTLVWRVLMLGVLGYLLPNFVLLWRRGQTVGKYATGLVVVDGSGATLPLWRHLVRAPFFFLPYLFLLIVPGIVPLVDLGFVFTRDQRALHDRLCRTRVVRRQPVVGN